MAMSEWLELTMPQAIVIVGVIISAAAVLIACIRDR